MRRRTGANERVEKRLSILSFATFLAASVIIFFGTDLWQNSPRILSDMFQIGRKITADIQIESMVFSVGFLWLLIPLHLLSMTSLRPRRGHIVRLDARRLRKLSTILKRRRPRLEFLTPYPECAEVQPRALAAALMTVRGPATFELVGCRGSVALLATQEGRSENEVSDALSQVYDNLRTCDFTPTRGMKPRIGDYLAGAYAIFNDNEFTSLQGFDKSHDIISNLARVMTKLHEGCGSYVQITMKSKDYSSIGSRKRRSMGVHVGIGERGEIPSHLKGIADEIESKINMATFAIGINVVAWAPTRRLAERTLEVVCRTISLRGQHCFIVMNRANGFEILRHTYSNEPYCPLPFSNEELPNLVHPPTNPCFGVRIVRSAPRGAGRFSSEDENGVKVGWDLT